MLITLVLYQAMKWWGWTKRKSPHTAQHGKDGQTHQQHYNFERRARRGGHHDKILYIHTSLLLSFLDCAQSVPLVMNTTSNSLLTPPYFPSYPWPHFILTHLDTSSLLISSSLFRFYKQTKLSGVIFPLERQQYNKKDFISSCCQNRNIAHSHSCHMAAS